MITFVGCSESYAQRNKRILRNFYRPALTALYIYALCRRLDHACPSCDACAIPTAPVKFFALIERVSALEGVVKFPKFNPRLLNVIGIIVIHRKG